MGQRFDFERVLAAADAALYTVKGAGGDQIERAAGPAASS
jgi:hypothetical protein